MRVVKMYMLQEGFEVSVKSCLQNKRTVDRNRKKLDT